MNATPIERRLWDHLASRGQVQGEFTATVRAPWPIRLLMGAAGWLGALFCQLFVLGFVFGFARTSGAGTLVVGLALLAGAAACYRAAGRDGTRIAIGQFALALSLGGQGLMVAGLSLLLGSGIWGQGSLFWLIVAALEAVLFFLIPSRLHRFLMALGAWSALAIAATLAIGPLGGARTMLLPIPVGGLCAFAMAGVAAFVWQEDAVAASGRHGMWAPAADASLLFGLGAALTVTGIAHPAAILLGPGNPWPVPGAWTAGALLGVTLVACAALECRRLAVTATATIAVLAVAAAFSVLMLLAPAVTAGVLALAYALRRGSAPWLGLAITTLLLGFAWYYSTLQWTLLAKSITLAVAGVVLLAARKALPRARRLP